MPPEGNLVPAMPGPWGGPAAWPCGVFITVGCLSWLKSGWDMATLESTWLRTVAAAGLLVTAV